MDINKKIVKSLLEKNYSDMKDLVYKSLYAKASLLMDEERVAVADVLFNEGSGGMYDDDDTAVAPAKKKPTDGMRPHVPAKPAKPEKKTPKFNRFDEAAKTRPAGSAVSNPGKTKVTDSDEIARIQQKRDRKRASQA